MKLKIFTVYDRVVDAHSVLFTSINEGTAVRFINMQRKSPHSNLNEYPHELDLYEVGEFSDHDGSVHPSPLRKIGSLKSLEQPNES